ncbi:MAG TPA: SPOR domain-containing protein [Gammaproteobacteria bacterium]|nr:SPOR domain-containing protein [Gammaproteobacteria bacterium]
MDISLKQRLVGAAVLVALGVIFIPMILERNSDDESLTVRMEIPPKPEMEFKNRLEDPPAVEEVEWPESVEEATAEIRAENSAGQPPAAEIPEAVRPAEPEKESPEPKPTPRNPPPSVKAPKIANETPRQWIVQLGSFSKETNALVMEDKLKAAGYKAFVKAADTPAGRVYRVRIGPMSDQNAAQQMVTKLNGQGHRAIIMAYPEQTTVAD